MPQTRTLVIRALIALAIAHGAAAQTAPTTVISPSPILQFWDLNGKPLAGGQVCVYAAGTTNPVTLYKDAAATSEWGNPITLDSSGRAVAYAPGVALKYVLRVKGNPNNCASGSTLYSVDNIQDAGLRLRSDLAGANGGALIGMQQPGGNMTNMAAILSSMYVWDYAYTTLSAACTAAVSAGKQLALTKVWTGIATFTCGAVPFPFGGTIQMTSAATITIPCPANTGYPKQIFDVSLSVGANWGTSPPVKWTTSCEPDVRWFGNDNAGAGLCNGAQDSLYALDAATHSLPVLPQGLMTASGQPVRMGRVWLPQGQTCIVTNTWLLPGDISVYGTGAYGAFQPGGNTGAPTAQNATVQLALGAAVSGAETFVAAVDPVMGCVGCTYGTDIENVTFNGNAGYSDALVTLPGNNARSSGLKFYGAQGANTRNVIIENVGNRGFVFGGNGGDQIGYFHLDRLVAVDVIQGPGVDIEDGGTARIDYLNIEHVNPGNILDPDGDPYAALYENGTNAFSMGQFITETKYAAVKLNNTTHAHFDSMSLVNIDGVTPTAVIIQGAIPPFTDITYWQGRASGCYTNIIVDRVNMATVPGGAGCSFPHGSYQPLNAATSLSFNGAQGINPLVTFPTVGGQINQAGANLVFQGNFFNASGGGSGLFTLNEGTGLALANTLSLAFSSTGTIGGALDTCVGRAGANILAISNCAGGAATTRSGNFQPTVNYLSLDGTAGITGSSCHAWKNGLCTAP